MECGGRRCLPSCYGCSYCECTPHLFHGARALPLLTHLWIHCQQRGPPYCPPSSLYLPHLAAPLLSDLLFSPSPPSPLQVCYPSVDPSLHLPPTYPPPSSPLQVRYPFLYANLEALTVADVRRLLVDYKELVLKYEAATQVCVPPSVMDGRGGRGRNGTAGTLSLEEGAKR